MKIILIAHGQTIDNEVTDIRVDNNIAGCTKWKNMNYMGREDR